MQIIRRYQPDGGRQIEALLLVLGRGPSPSGDQSETPADQSEPSGEGASKPHGTRLRPPADLKETGAA